MSILAWTFEPITAAFLVVGMTLYAAGLRLSWRSSGWRDHVSAAASFGGGCMVIAIALMSPLDAAADQLFSAHMVQHELLMILAAPLLVLGNPGVVMLRGLQRGVRRQVGATLRLRWVRSVWRSVSRPFNSWLLHGAAIWCWHVPVLFQAALRHEAVHALQHVCFVLTAMLFWWVVIHPRRRAARGMAILYLFTTATHTAVLGALLTLARAPWYVTYAGRPSQWGMTPLEDQQLAGLIMWVPASVAYLIAALFTLRAWLRESARSVEYDERAATLPPSTPAMWLRQ